MPISLKILDERSASQIGAEDRDRLRAGLGDLVHRRSQSVGRDLGEGIIVRDPKVALSHAIESLLAEGSENLRLKSSLYGVAKSIALDSDSGAAKCVGKRQHRRARGDTGATLDRGA
jgi:hypothetical protein